MSVAAPERTLEQRMAALRRANAVRVARAETKRRIAAGEDSLPEILRNPADHMLSARVFDLLCAQRGIGVHIARRQMMVCQIAGDKRVNGLSARQRRVLANHIVSEAAAALERRETRLLRSTR